MLGTAANFSAPAIHPEERPTASPFGHAVSVIDATRTFGRRKALDSVSLTIGGGEMVALIGSSGAGKSTLLRLISGLSAADTSSGEILVGGRVIQSSGRISRNVRVLRAEIGFIFQQFNLVDRLSLIMNVLAGHLSKVPLYRRLIRLFNHKEKLTAMHALQTVGLADYATQRSGTLSGGQQQRAAIARTMVQGAKLILADEPIASLDPESARLVMESLRQLNQRDGVTVIVSVHQLEHAKRFCDRIVALREGKIYCDCRAEELSDEMIERLYERKILPKA